MGLDVSHDAFRGAYSTFNRLRQAVAKAIGGSFPSHQDPVKYPDSNVWHYDDELFDLNAHPGVRMFLCWSDCDGEHTPEECAVVARDLESIIQKIDEGLDWGHLAAVGGSRAALQKFIDGCKRASGASEKLVFH